MHKKIKTTITLSSHIKEFATQEAEALGLDFSAYVTVLIAEKLRSTTIIGNNVSNISNNKASESIGEISVSIEPKEMDNSQIDELDRLLSLNQD